MNFYTIELKRVSYVTIQIEAATQDDAEAMAWKQIDQDYYRDDGAWEVESIEQQEFAPC